MSKYSKLHHLLNSAFECYRLYNAFNDYLLGNYTYDYVRLQSNQIATFLATRNVMEHDRIVICASKSIESAIALFGVILAKGVYVPVDCQTPLQRCEKILNDCQPKGLIAEESLSQKLLALNCVKEMLDIPGSSLKYLPLEFSEKKSPGISEDLAYILYTSGSTGVPKGVMITHENALSFIEWAATHFDFSSNDVFSSVAPFHFDLSVFDLFVAIWHGAKVVLMNESTIRNPLVMSSMIEHKGITVWYSTPTVLMLLMKYGKPHRNNLQSLRTVLYAGEVFPGDLLRSFQQTWPHVSLYNLYGPTETNVCTWLELPHHLNDDFDTTIIGKSCSHVSCKILDDDQEIVNPIPGNLGELIVSGSAVSPGYLNLPEANYSSFIMDELGLKWYRTGDSVMVMNNGDFKFLGRIDRMVKKRGYRIELGEIEKVIAQHPLAERVGVIATQQNGDLLIKAFIQCHENEMRDTAAVKKFTANRLPAYMLPDAWIWLEELPLTNTQKMDYQQLKSLKV